MRDFMYLLKIEKKMKCAQKQIYIYRYTTRAPGANTEPSGRRELNAKTYRSKTTDRGDRGTGDRGEQGAEVRTEAKATERGDRGTSVQGSETVTK